jgi:hypothetical protein
MDVEHDTSDIPALRTLDIVYVDETCVQNSNVESDLSDLALFQSVHE